MFPFMMGYGLFQIVWIFLSVQFVHLHLVPETTSIHEQAGTITAYTTKDTVLWTDLPTTYLDRQGVWTSLRNITDTWFNQSSNLTPDHILLSCNRSDLTKWLATRSKRYCYSNSGLIVPQNVDSTYSMFSEKLITKENWKQLLYIGYDRGEMIVSVPGILSAYMSCTNFHDKALKQIDALDDYYNVIVNCPTEYHGSILNKIYDLSRQHRVRFNWVFINTTVDEFNHFSMLDEGENAAFIMSNPADSLTVDDHLKRISEDREYFSSPVTISWCLTDCYKPNKILRRVVIHRPDQLNDEHVTIAPSQFTQFYGRHILVTYASYKPFYYGVETNNETQHLGIEVNILETLAQAFNFSYTLVPAIDGTWGTDDGTGNWNGMIGMVFRKEVEMAISGITMTSYRNEVIDYLYPHWEASSAVILSVQSYKWRYFIKAFSSNTWLAVLLTPVLISIILVIVKYTNDRTFDEEITRTLVDEDSVEEIEHVFTQGVTHYLVIWRNYYFAAFGALLMQGNRVQTRSDAYKFVFGAFWIWVIIIAATYSGNLTASLAVKSFKMPFNTLNELADNDDYVFQVRIGAFREQIFREASGGVYKRLWDKIQREQKDSLITDQDFALERVLQGGYTYTASKIRLDEIVRSTGREDLVILKETYYKTGKALVVQSGVPYQKYFHNVVLHLMQSGVVEYWTRIHSTKDLRKLSASLAQHNPITLSDVSLAFSCIMAVGMGLALFVLILEHIVFAVLKT